MLPAAARMRQRAEFTTAVRGRRAGVPALVVHYRAADEDGPARVGFIVGRSVGAAVVRNRVRRRLRHLMRTRLDLLPAGARVVVRAGAPSAALSSAELGAQLDRALDRVLSDRTPA